MKQSFQIQEKDGQQGIKCLECNLTSWNSNDVNWKYCAKCDKFHDIPFKHEGIQSPCHGQRLVPVWGKTSFTHQGIEYKDEPWWFYVCPNENCGGQTFSTTLTDTISIEEFEKRHGVKWV